MKINKIKNLVRKILNGAIFLSKNDRYPATWIGNLYGGFFVCPEYFNRGALVYSFGIGEDMSFDNEMIKQYGCSVFGFDPTPKSVVWVEKQEKQPEFRFLPIGIGSKNQQMIFYLPKNDQNVSGSLVLNNNRVSSKNGVEVEIKTLKTIMKNKTHEKINILKLDIEGSEYEVIESIINDNIKPDQILVEFHSRFFHNGILKTINAVRKLKRYGYILFAISDSGEEMSFIRK